MFRAKVFVRKLVDIKLSLYFARLESLEIACPRLQKFGRPNSGGKGKLFSIISVSILIYLKRNSFNSHYYYTFDILINLMVYLAE
jgi:hypothetical protein